MSAKIRWGVLGVAKIAVEKVIPAMQQGEFAEVAAIASRDAARAASAAESLGIAKSYGPTRSSWPIRTSTPSTIRCPTICTFPGR